MVQHAVRAWLLRRGLQRFAAARRRGVAAVVRLQAVWRGRAVRRQYQQQRQAAICIQVRACLLALGGILGVASAARPSGTADSRRRPHSSSCLLNARLAAHLPMPMPAPVQAAYRGRRQRRAFFHHMVVPRMLQAGLAAKRRLEGSRWVAVWEGHEGHVRAGGHGWAGVMLCWCGGGCPACATPLMSAAHDAP